MKYRQLTKEQFESLHEEFSRFLATQQIDVKEWNKIKEEKPEVAEDEMNIFSDLVWEKVLTETKYLDHYSKHSLNLFKCEEEQIHRILIKVSESIDLTSKEGFQWLIDNSKDASVEYFKATKKYNKERNEEIFSMVEQGCDITKGDYFEKFSSLISEK
ncbi:DUF6495 family protein [Aureivirga sp. CE67]|uniref:DUF6495 family protein n=1 Tax=Aureivirga sp. CE67 TaxID=1788983 RepID=UPI0018CBAFA0|nr:DUF6495 family protein [Aureivirga sp. CE67]